MKEVKYRPSLLDMKRPSLSLGKLGMNAKKRSIRENKPELKQKSKKVSSVKMSSADRRSPLLVIAGEHSGDLLGAELLRVLSHLGFSKFVGTGGTLMEHQKLELVEGIENMTAVGIVEALKIYPRLKRLARNLCNLAQSRKIKTAILIDYPGFNLHIAGMLKKIGIRIIYLVSPQIWAWHYSRIRGIKKNVDLMLTLFAFEEKIYRREGVPCHWVGHPLFHHIPRRLVREKSLPNAKRVSLKKSEKAKRLNIGIFPGSRPSEVKQLLGDIIKAVQLLHKKYPHGRFLIGGVNTQIESWIKEVLKDYTHLPIEYHFRRSLRIMQACDVLILASGTVTLEAAYFKKPMLILYRTGWINSLVASFVMRVPCVGMVNLLLQRQVVPELLQTEVTPENISQAVQHLIEDKSYRKRIIGDLDLVCKQLDAGNPARKAARYIAEFI